MDTLQRLLPQLGKATVGASQAVGNGRQIVGQARALLHRRAFFRQRRLLPRFGAKAGQFIDGMGQIVTVARGGIDGRAGFCQYVRRLAPGPICRADRACIAAAIGIEQRAMPPRIEQTAIVMLAVNFHQAPAQFAQQRSRAG